MMKKLFVTFMCVGTLAHAQTQLLRYPDVSKDHVAFVYAGDIYLASITGGDATRLTSHAGLELFPKFSPDGKQIAFSAEYSGSRQVYVMPIDGSREPKQLTWYNDIGVMPPRGGFDYRVLDFSPDGKNVLVRMNRLGMDERAGRPYWVPVGGGDETPLPVPETGGGMLSADGKQYVYTPIDREFRTWKRTRGGRAQDVWLFDLSTLSAKQLTQSRATDNQPMFLGDAIYFTSDRNYTLNLFRTTPDGTEPTQITFHEDFDVLWPSAGPDAIVYEQAGLLHLLKAGDKQSSPLKITVRGDHAGLLPQVKNVQALVDSAALAPNGERALFAARGEVFSVGVTQGDVQNLSQTPAAREMSLALAADGKSFVYLSDQSGEYELYWQALDQTAAPVALTRQSKHWYLQPVIAADASVVLLADSENRLWWVNRSGEKTLVDTASIGEQITDYALSPNAAAAVYTKQNSAGMSEIWWFEATTQRKQRVLGGQFDAFAPAFDPNGRYLYFASKRDHNLTYSSYEENYLYTQATRLFAVPLHEGGPFFGAITDVNHQGTSKLDVSKAIGAKIALDQFEKSAEALPIPAGNYSNLSANKAGLFFVSAVSQGNAELRYFDLESKKSDWVAGNVSGYDLGTSGEQLLISAGGKWLLADAKARPDLNRLVDLTKLTLRIDPKIEWPQIYADALRVFRTWFYDAGMHGNDWQALEQRYSSWVPHVASRDDLDYVLGEIAGELNAGHAYVNRGDTVQVPRIESGLLGGEFSRTATGRYRIDKIFAGQNWSEEFRSPLSAPGVNLAVGDEIIAINGVDTNSVQNFYQLLEGLGNQIVRLRVQRAGKAQNVLVKTITAETNLRYLDWVMTRAEMVNKLSNGRIGYIHLPNTAIEGNRELFKQFPSQINKDALIIDDRYNGGGFIPDRMIEILARKPLNYWKRRGLAPQSTPRLSHRGPKAMLINGLSSSGGDALPYYFKSLNLGLLIGTRTWGGLIGLSGNPPMVDGGSVTAPDFRILSTDNQWVVEDEGVVPDIEVIDRPDALAAGRDPSLERAVQELLKQLKANPPKAIEAPPAPTKFGTIN